MGAIATPMAGKMGIVAANAFFFSRRRSHDSGSAKTVTRLGARSSAPKLERIAAIIARAGKVDGGGSTLAQLGGLYQPGSG